MLCPGFQEMRRCLVTHLASSALAHGTSVEASTSCFVSAGFDCVFSGIKDAGGCLGLDSLGFFPWKMLFC